MEANEIEAVRRTVIGKQVKALRREGKLPAIMYGSTIDPTPVLMDRKAASTTLGQMASSSLVTINLEGEKHVALVREKQRNVLTGALTHVDFQVVSMKERIRTRVSIETRGEAPAIKNFNGILVLNLDAVEIEALPGDLPERIVVDVSRLESIGMSIRLGELDLPEKITVLDDMDQIVVVITAQEAEEVTEAVAEEAVGAEPEVVEKGKKEEEEE